VRVLARGIWWNDCFTPPFGEPVPEPARVIGAVREEFARRRHSGQQCLCAGQIMGVAWRQDQGQRAPALIGQRMNLGRPSAARSSDGLSEVPPFAPAAERCALTWVESTAVVLMTPLEPLRA
jgi:hypothetical protein